MTDKSDHGTVATEGNRIFDERVAKRVRDRDPWDAVVIDVRTGEFEVDRDVLTALDRLRSRTRDPDPGSVFARRVGFESMEFLGYHPPRGASCRER